jgi:hypothetical protein
MKKAGHGSRAIITAMTRIKKQPQHTGKEKSPDGGALRIPSIPIAEVLNFLKETRGAVTWTAQQMIDALKISPQDAEQRFSFQATDSWARRMHKRKSEDNSGARQDPNLICTNRRKDSAPREFQSCMDSPRCGGEGLSTGLARPVGSQAQLTPGGIRVRATFRKATSLL